MSDRPEEENEAVRVVAQFAAALTFLTRIPIPAQLNVRIAPMPGALRGFPLVGVPIGILTGVALVIASSLHFPSLAASALAIAVTAMVTGGLHEDGLADCADGFGGGRDRMAKLSIMRDSRIGSYGVLALVLALLVKASALAALAAQPWLSITALTVAAASWSRALMVALLYFTPPARSDGLSASVGRPSRQLTVQTTAIGGLIVMVCATYAVGIEAALVALLVSSLLAVGFRILAMRQVGGQTGDVCGAVQMTAEISMIVAFSSTFY